MRKRDMNWIVYISLIFWFGNNPKTKDLLNLDF